MTVIIYFRNILFVNYEAVKKYAVNISKRRNRGEKEQIIIGIAFENKCKCVDIDRQC